MKVKLIVSTERYDEIKRALIERGIEIDDNADLVLSENNRFPDNLIVREFGAPYVSTRLSLLDSRRVLWTAM